MSGAETNPPARRSWTWVWVLAAFLVVAVWHRDRQRREERRRLDAATEALRLQAEEDPAFRERQRRQLEEARRLEAEARKLEAEPGEADKKD